MKNIHAQVRSNGVMLGVLAVTLSLQAADWPRLGGPEEIGVSPETGLARSWPETGPKIRWTVDVGEGYAGPAISGDEVFLLDRVPDVEDVLRCFDLEKGNEKWHAVTSQRAIKEIPPGFKATLESDRTNYFLGENILLHYRVENVGDKSFGISTGGSFPTPHFTNLFEIKVVSSTGEIVFDPIRTHVNSEGVMIRNEVKPGGKFDEKYLLNRYCRLEKPGTYKIVMFWSLGFGDKMEKDVREVSLDIHELDYVGIVTCSGAAGGN